MPDLHTVCLRPGGMNRGGIRHEGHKVHDIDAFTPAQLREMDADPNLVLILGGEKLTDKHIAATPAGKAEAKAVAEAAAKAEADAKAAGAKVKA